MALPRLFQRFKPRTNQTVHGARIDVIRDGAAWTQQHLVVSVEPRLSKIAHFSCKESASANAGARLPKYWLITCTCVVGKNDTHVRRLVLDWAHLARSISNSSGEVAAKCWQICPKFAPRTCRATTTRFSSNGGNAVIVCAGRLATANASTS